MKIAMIGTGYVGLVSGVCFSDFGHEVICVDKNPAKIEMLRAGEVPIYEPGLDELMAKKRHGREVVFFHRSGRCGRWRRCGFYRGWHPTRRGDGHADLTYVMAAAEEIAAASQAMQ